MTAAEADPPPENIKYNKCVRRMPNGHWSIPFSACFVMRNIDEFDAEAKTMDVAFTMILRIKFNGLPNMKEIMDWCEENLKCRVAEAEAAIVKEPDDDGFGRSGKIVRTKSGNWKKGDELDILSFTLRCKEKFKTDSNHYYKFPFDKLPFYYRFELSHFEHPPKTDRK